MYPSFWSFDVSHLDSCKCITKFLCDRSHLIHAAWEADLFSVIYDLSNRRPYFKGGAKPITIRVSDFDRAAPHGTGHIKAGLNYAMSLHAIVDAHNQGFAENMYLDPATRTKVEETGGANFLFITKDGTFVTPKSDSILPSITRRSLMVVAEKYLGLKVEHREVLFDEVKDFAECGLCGTAAVISPVGKIVDHGKEICFPSGMEEMGPVTKKLRDTLTGIQMGHIEGPEGWVHEIM